MSYNSLVEEYNIRYHPRKQEMLYNIMRMKSFQPLYIKLCSTEDYGWIDTLSLVIDELDKIDRITTNDENEIILYIIYKCQIYTDISDAATNHIKSKTSRCGGCSIFRSFKSWNNPF